MAKSTTTKNEEQENEAAASLRSAVALEAALNVLRENSQAFNKLGNLKFIDLSLQKIDLGKQLDIINKTIPEATRNALEHFTATGGYIKSGGSVHDVNTNIKSAIEKAKKEMLADSPPDVLFETIINIKAELLRKIHQIVDEKSLDISNFFAKSAVLYLFALKAKKQGFQIAIIDSEGEIVNTIDGID